jgi:hypothetical protein
MVDPGAHRDIAVATISTKRCSIGQHASGAEATKQKLATFAVHCSPVSSAMLNG